MTTTVKKTITVETLVKATPEHVWEAWTNPRSIEHWNHASEDWHAPHAVNDLREGGSFSCRMEARDGSVGFDFGGTYTKIVPMKEIRYALGDGRSVTITFTPRGDNTHVREEFEPENDFSLELQQSGWQAILDNFAAFAEYTKVFEPLYFEIRIKAPRPVVWEAMLNKASYEEWVSAAWPGSTLEGEWKEGATILFLGADRSGTKARLIHHHPFQSISEHTAILNKGAEDTTSEMAKGWAGTKETYTLVEQDGGTLVKVAIFCTKGWKDMFVDDWPKALEKLKEITERKQPKA